MAPTDSSSEADPDASLVDATCSGLVAAATSLQDLAAHLTDSDVLWTGRRQASPPLQLALRTFSTALALLMERYFALSTDWSVLPAGVRGVGHELAAVKNQLQRVTAERDAALQKHATPTPPGSASSQCVRTPPPQAPAAPPLPGRSSPRPTLAPARGFRTPSPPLHGLGESRATSPALSYASVVRPPVVVAPPRASSRRGSPAPRRSPTPGPDTRSQLQAMAQLSAVLPDADVPTLSRLSSAFAAPQSAPTAPSPPTRASRHRAALPQARAVHRPATAARPRRRLRRSRVLRHSTRPPERSRLRSCFRWSLRCAC